MIYLFDRLQIGARARLVRPPAGTCPGGLSSTPYPMTTEFLRK